MLLLFLASQSDKSFPELAEAVGKGFTALGLTVAGACTIIRVVIREIYGVKEDLHTHRKKGNPDAEA